MDRPLKLSVRSLNFPNDTTFHEFFYQNFIKLQIIYSLGNPIVSLAEGTSTELDEGQTRCDNEGNGIGADEKSGDEWFVPQNPLQQNVQITIQPPTYGFASKVSGVLDSFEVCCIQILFIDLVLRIPRS